MKNAQTQDLASMSVELRLQDFQEAALHGTITDTQALALWVQFCGKYPGSVTPQEVQAHSSPSNGLHYVTVLYYFFALVAICAMTLFLTLGLQAVWAAGLLAIGLAYGFGGWRLAHHFKAKRVLAPASVLAVSAVCLVPLVVLCALSLQQLFGT